MKITKSLLLYDLLMNVPVCFFLCLTGSLLVSLDIDWAIFGINYAVSFVIAYSLGLFVPLVKIGKWFTALFKVDTTTYKGNIKYRLLSTLIISLIYFISINPALTVLNYFLVPGLTVMECFMHWLVNIPIMLLVGFLAPLLFDLGAYKITNKIDPNF